ncbi:MAG: VPLPA-CTERM sorting domain-containing protein [Parvularculaceae bacterium]|nr:VPLPA-CTERM sorting domain-containing protein [Parvularculaceae bacterium]
MFKHLIAAAAVALLPITASAETIVIDGGQGQSIFGGEGRGRGISFIANQDFSIDSAGIFFDLLNESFDVLIYSSTNGSDTVALLESESAVVGGSGSAWYDISVDFDFLAGNYYFVGFQPSDLGTSDWSGGNGFYESDSAVLPLDLGVLTAIDGAEGNQADGWGFANTLHPVIRFNGVDSAAVPLPAAPLLMLTGLAGLAAAQRKKKAA